jgi:hypothetical protein
MSAKVIEKLLTEALLEGGKMYQELYEYELEEQIEELRESLAEDDDDYLFVVTENNGHIAMLLLESDGSLHINEVAREKLKEFWPGAYEKNMHDFIPMFAQELADGELVINGVKKASNTISDAVDD